jgi:hypothetical protein
MREVDGIGPKQFFRYTFTREAKLLRARKKSQQPPTSHATGQVTPETWLLSTSNVAREQAVFV